jgi:predicted alpha/beta superfamily hydrolase
VINNVRPYVDNAFRTLNDARNTATLGSSLGGLISLYLGREYSTFGKIGVLSPAFWIAPSRRLTGTTRSACMTRI